MSQLKQILIQRLEKKGIEPSAIPGFVRSLANSFFVYPHMNLMRVNNHLHYLGWNGFELDYFTLQLALECLEADGLRRLENKPARWFENRFKAA